ncbi:MAG: hypothetical protein QOD06_296 [Candidatus Binatota bacterium]|jgi:hypothetical protein|nr:hypothetical protein [Candidatus Binatota bacterium]
MISRRQALLVVAATACACRPDAGSARGVAERFLDAHYVDIDLGTAEGLAAGVARNKVAEERRLTTGHRIDETTRKPTVYYRLLEQYPEGEARVRFVYRATFAVDGAGNFDRRILLVLRREQADWKVANFEEFE